MKISHEYSFRHMKYYIKFIRIDLPFIVVIKILEKQLESKNEACF